MSARRLGLAGLLCATLAGCTPGEAHVGGVLVLLLVAHAWLCAVAWAMPRAWTASVRVMASVVVLGLAGYAVFWAYFLAPAAGRWFAGAVLVAPAVAAALAQRRAGVSWRDLAAVQAVALPSLALAMLVLWAGLYPFAWEGTDWAVPALRWRDMPVDNWLPFMVAEMLADGRIVSPMLEQWLSSDRPPLQSGISLLFSPLVADHAGLAYQASSSWTQALVLVPLAAMLAVLPTPGRRAVALVVAGMSAVVFFNTLFVWPKLLAAAYCAMYHLLLLGRGGGRDAGPDRARLAAAGLVAALALLSHGGAAFALAGSTVVFLVARRWRSVLQVGGVAAAAIAAYLPWMLYQRLVDPPGDRLLKWHFAGQIDVTERGLPQVLADAYGALPPGAWWQGRKANLDAVADGALRFFSDATVLATGDTAARVRPMVEASFFSTAYSTWCFSLLLLVPLLAIAATRRIPLREAWTPGLAAATAVSLVVWILSMFMPGSTIVHAGSYLTTIGLLLMVAGLAARVAPPLFHLLAAGNVAVACTLYVFDRPWSSLPAPAAYAAVAGLLVAAFIATCFLGQRTVAPRPHATGHLA